MKSYWSRADFDQNVLINVRLIRFKKINGQIDNPAEYNEIKKSIARLYTTINLKGSK